MVAFVTILTATLLLLTVFKVNAFQTGGAPKSLAFAPRRASSFRGPLQAVFIDEIASAYSYGMSNYYFETQSVTGGVLCGLGDAIAQVKERLSSGTNYNRGSIDVGRIARFALKGLVGGIIWSHWYGVVDEMSLSVSKQVLDICGDEAVFGEGIHRVAQTVSAILLEQFVACPLIYSLWDIPFPMIMNGTPVESVPEQVKQKIGPLLLENAKVWSFLNIVIYNLPAQYRLLIMSIADVFWQSVIASMATAEVTADASGDEVVLIDEAASRKVPARLTE